MSKDREVYHVYYEKKGEAVPDHKVLKWAKGLLEKDLRTSTELAVTAVRVLCKRGTIPYDKVCINIIQGTNITQARVSRYGSMIDCPIHNTMLDKLLDEIINLGNK